MHVIHVIVICTQMNMYVLYMCQHMNTYMCHTYECYVCEYIYIRYVVFICECIYVCHVIVNMNVSMHLLCM